MAYHVRIFIKGSAAPEAKFDLSREQLESRILDPYANLRPLVINGRTIVIEKIDRVEIVETPHDSSSFHELVTTLARQGTHEWYYGENARDVTDNFITTPSIHLLPQRTDAIELICSRFHTVVSQLRQRHADRSTLDVSDEYDVQDLMHSLLRLFFDDVRPEEWTPSYAGGSSRMDFLLHAEEIVVETKKTRAGSGARDLGNQLIEDIARYRAHPRCKQLVCFVYDPEGRVANPRGIERDLAVRENGFEAKVFICPRN